MAFLNPALLWALPVAAAPVIVHLIFLRRARRIEFSDLTLLRAAYSRTLPATRLRQWLLMLLRCLILALAVLVFARPVVHRGAASGGSEAGLDMVLLVDTSWSMGAMAQGKPRFETAVQAAGTIIDRLRPDDRVAVAAFSDRLEAELRFSESASAARAALRSLRSGYRKTDGSGALGAAYRFLAADEKESIDPAEDGERSGKRRRVIVLLSDNAVHGMRKLENSGIKALPGYDPEVTLLGLEWDGEIDNGGVHSVRPAASGDLDRTALVARTILHSGSLRSGNLDLWIQDRRVDQRSIASETGLGRPLTFKLPPSRRADHWGRFSLRADALSVDDDYYFSLRIQPKPRVLLLYGNSRYLEAGRGGYFLKKLLQDSDRLPFLLEIAERGRINELRFEDYGVVWLADFQSLPPGLAERLERYVARGGGLWVLAGTQAETDTYHGLRRIMPARLGGQSSIGGSMSPQDLPEETVDAERPFAWNEFELRNVNIDRRYRLEPKPEAGVWFRGPNRSPVLVGGSFGQGRVLVWGSSLDIEWTNLALKPVFTAWIDIGLRWLSRYSGRHQWRTLLVGQSLEREWGPAEQPPPKVQVIGPGGRSTVLIVRDRKIRYEDTRVPGIYRLRPIGGGDAGATEAFAVNVDRATDEGDLTRAAQPPWRPIRLGALREDFTREVYGREVRGGALLLAALLLLLEAWLARPRREPAPVSAEAVA